MSKFNVGDRVRPNIPGVPLDTFPPVEVLELGECDEEDGPDRTCALGGETFRFKDPESGDDDWAHTSEFEVVS